MAAGSSAAEKGFLMLLQSAVLETLGRHKLEISRTMNEDHQPDIVPAADKNGLAAQQPMPANHTAGMKGGNDGMGNRVASRDSMGSWDMMAEDQELLEALIFAPDDGCNLDDCTGAY